MTTYRDLAIKEQEKIDTVKKQLKWNMKARKYEKMGIDIVDKTDEQLMVEMIEKENPFLKGLK